MIPVLAIPHLNRPDLLHRCLRSIDFPVGDLVLIQNGRDEDTDIPEVLRVLQGVDHKRFTHIRGPNLGVGNSWNYAMLAFSATYWMFLGNDMYPADGDLERMHQAYTDFGDEFGFYFGGHGHSFFIQTSDCVDKLGLYDPSYFPAYLEDSDCMRRAHLLGIRYLDVPNINAIHGTPDMPGSCSINSDPSLREQNMKTHGNNFGYYVQKHGGLPGKETFQHPFNTPGIPWDYVQFKPSRRDANLWK